MIELGILTMQIIGLYISACVIIGFMGWWYNRKS